MDAKSPASSRIPASAHLPPIADSPLSPVSRSLPTSRQDDVFWDFRDPVNVKTEFAPVQTEKRLDQLTLIHSNIAKPEKAEVVVDAPTFTIVVRFKSLDAAVDATSIATLVMTHLASHKLHQLEVEVNHKE